jgi:hypothetical protein
MLKNCFETDESNPGSQEDVVELLVPELWSDYHVPGGTFRENLQKKSGQPQRIIQDFSTNDTKRYRHNSYPIMKDDEAGVFRAP